MRRIHVPRRTRKVLVEWAEGQLEMIGRRDDNPTAKRPQRTQEGPVV
jgi:hypothetical protein